MAQPSNKIEPYSTETISPTLTARMGTGGNQVPITHEEKSKAVRKLTPLECERLQGLPDGWTAIEFNGKPAPDSRRYKAIGNGMAQPCADFILESIVNGLEKEIKK
jgi:DNA (cytosine-5)-methyltransferase 1